MIDLQVLKKFGTTSERLREIFTAEGVPSDAPAEQRLKAENNLKLRRKWESLLQSRLDDAITRCLQRYQLYAAVDIAWDAQPINQETLPLVLYAQGKLDIKACASQLDSLKCAAEYVKRNADGRIESIDLPKFFDVNINLVRSMVTRRHAAQTNKYNNLYPFYKYHPRGTSQQAKLFADVVSEVVETIVDEYDYRHHDAQVDRDVLLYGKVVDFVRSGWESDSQLAFTPLPEGAEVPIEERQVDEKLCREGLVFTNPHPTRIYKDPAYPWSTLNSDTGAAYCGYWDIVPYGSVCGPPFFNIKDIAYSSGFTSLFDTYRPYWSQYYCQIKIPSCINMQPLDNDQRSQIGKYGSEQADSAALVNVYFQKIRPIEWGVGTYPHPVWIRLATAGSLATVIHAEILPSRPGAYAGLNENDNRDVSLSFAMEMLPFQDQLTNLYTQLLAVLKLEQLKIIGINTDAIPDEATLKEIRQIVGGKNWFAEPILLEYSASRMIGTGVEMKNPISIVQPQSNPQSINYLFQAIVTTLQMAERIAAMSPNESGQPIARGNGGVSATEAEQLQQTTNALYAFVSDSIDEFRSAKKRIVYESWVNMGREDFVVAIGSRFPRSLVEKYFTVVDGDIETDVTDALRFTLAGKKQSLQLYDYVFSSRDGAERVVNAQTAQTLVQMLQIIQNPLIAELIGKERIVAITNEIFRLSGAGFDLSIDPDEATVPLAGVNELEQIRSSIDKIVQAIESIVERLNGAGIPPSGGQAQQQRTA